MSKYVRCIDTTNDQRKLLQLEHIYKVIDETEVDYVIDINGKQMYCRKTRFIVEGEQFERLND